VERSRLKTLARLVLEECADLYAAGSQYRDGMIERATDILADQFGRSVVTVRSPVFPEDFAPSGCACIGLVNGCCRTHSELC
jgi:hypothetical protein